MNWTNFEHAIYAVIIQLSLGWLVGYDNSAYIAISILFGREYAQAEYKARKTLALSLTKMQLWHVIDRRFWSLDALLDILIPVLVVSVVYYMVIVC